MLKKEEGIVIHIRIFTLHPLFALQPRLYILIVISGNYFKIKKGFDFNIVSHE